MSWLRSRWFGALQWVVTAAILVAIGLHFAKQWDQVQESGVALAFRPGWLVLSLLMVWAMWVVLIEGWRRLAIGWGVALPWRLAGRIWMLSSFGKYLPGKVWAAAGMVTMSERAGVSGKVTLAAAVVMQALGIGAGVAVASLAAGPLLTEWYPDAGRATILIGVAVAGMLLVVGNRTVLRKLWKLARRTGPAPEPPATVLLIGCIAVNLLAWLVYGAALVVLARGLLPDVALGWREATGAYTVAYIAGYLGPAPAGLGIRDSLLALMLATWMGPGEALALAATSRIASTINELGAAAPFYFSRESARDSA